MIWFGIKLGMATGNIWIFVRSRLNFPFRVDFNVSLVVGDDQRMMFQPHRFWSSFSLFFRPLLSQSFSWITYQCRWFFLHVFFYVFIFICLLQVVTRVFFPRPLQIFAFHFATLHFPLCSGRCWGVLSNTMIFGSVWTWGLPEHGSFRVHMIRHQLLGCLIFRQNQQGHAVFFTTCGPRRGSTWHWSWMKRSGTLSWFGIHGKYLRIVQDQVTTISQKSCGQDELDEQVSDDCGCVSKWSASHWYPQVHWSIIIFCLITYNSHLG
jgi:hypothetical protein